MDSQWDIFALNLFLGMRHLLAFMWILWWWNAEGGNFALMQSRWHSLSSLPFLQPFRTALTKNQYSMTWEVSPNKMFYKAKCVVLAFSVVDMLVGVCCRDEMGTEVKIICGLTENVSSALLLKPQIAENGKNYFLGHFWKCHSETLPKMGHSSGWTSSMISLFDALPNIFFLCPGSQNFCFFKHFVMQICCFVSTEMARSCSWSDLTALILLRI